MDHKQIVFLNGLPGAGSCLLQSILSQNPDFVSRGPSPLLSMVFTLRASGFGGDGSAPHSIARRSMLDACRGLIYGFYSSFNGGVAVDLEGSLSLELHDLLLTTLPKAKRIFVVRDLRQVLCSAELYRRRHPEIDHFGVSKDDSSLSTINRRVGFDLTTGTTGVALRRLYDLIQRGEMKDQFIVRYEDLCRAPEATVGALYEYLGREVFQHRLDSISPLTETFPAFPVRAELAAKLELRHHDVNTVLGSDLSQEVMNSYRWYFAYFYPEEVAQEVSTVAPDIARLRV